MAHLGERIADYVIGEMTDSEAVEASAHIRQCSDCSQQVEAFKHTLALLQSVPDREPPRPLVFEVERQVQPAASWLWRWASPAVAAVAASILTVMLMAPPSVEPSPGAQSWLAAELQKRDQAHAEDVQRLRSEIDYWERQRLRASREEKETARAIQMLAQRLPSGD
jgi:anti-sigma factor RsiW